MSDTDDVVKCERCKERDAVVVEFEPLTKLNVNHVAVCLPCMEKAGSVWVFVVAIVLLVGACMLAVRSFGASDSSPPMIASFWLFLFVWLCALMLVAVSTKYVRALTRHRKDTRVVLDKSVILAILLLWVAVGVPPSVWSMVDSTLLMSLAVSSLSTGAALWSFRVLTPTNAGIYILTANAAVDLVVVGLSFAPPEQLITAISVLEASLLPRVALVVVAMVAIAMGSAREATFSPLTESMLPDDLRIWRKESAEQARRHALSGIGLPGHGENIREELARIMESGFEVSRDVSPKTSEGGQLGRRGNDSLFRMRVTKVETAPSGMVWVYGRLISGAMPEEGDAFVIGTSGKSGCMACVSSYAQVLQKQRERGGMVVGGGQPSDHFSFGIAGSEIAEHDLKAGDVVTGVNQRPSG